MMQTGGMVATNAIKRSKQQQDENSPGASAPSSLDYLYQAISLIETKQQHQQQLATSVPAAYTIMPSPTVSCTTTGSSSSHSLSTSDTASENPLLTTESVSESSISSYANNMSYLDNQSAEIMSHLLYQQQKQHQLSNNNQFQASVNYHKHHTQQYQQQHQLNCSSPSCWGQCESNSTLVSRQSSPHAASDFTISTYKQPKQRTLASNANNTRAKNVGRKQQQQQQQYQCQNQQKQKQQRQNSAFHIINNLASSSQFDSSASTSGSTTSSSPLSPSPSLLSSPLSSPIYMTATSLATKASASIYPAATSSTSSSPGVVNTVSKFGDLSPILSSQLPASHLLHQQPQQLYHQQQQLLQMNQQHASNAFYSPSDMLPFYLSSYLGSKQSANAVAANPTTSTLVAPVVAPVVAPPDEAASVVPAIVAPNTISPGTYLPMSAAAVPNNFQSSHTISSTAATDSSYFQNLFAAIYTLVNYQQKKQMLYSSMANVTNNHTQYSNSKLDQPCQQQQQQLNQLTTPSTNAPRSAANEFEFKDREKKSVTRALSKINSSGKGSRSAKNSSAVIAAASADVIKGCQEDRNDVNSLVDKHFRRSLGAKYFKLFSKFTSNIRSISSSQGNATKSASLLSLSDVSNKSKRLKRNVPEVSVS